MIERAVKTAPGNGGPASSVIAAGPLEVRPHEHLALADGRPLSLTLRELALLGVLAENEDRIVSREVLYDAVWGRTRRPADRLADVYVSRLRTKLDEAVPRMTFIHTHFGIGYRFSPEPRDRSPR